MSRSFGVFSVGRMGESTKKNLICSESTILFLIINFVQNSKIPPAAEPHVSTEFMCLMRAVFKNEKISTVVHAKDVNKFQLAYCNLLKNSMDGLKRQKKQKTKKATQ